MPISDSASYWGVRLDFEGLEAQRLVQSSFAELNSTEATWDIAEMS